MEKTVIAGLKNLFFILDVIKKRRFNVSLKNFSRNSYFDSGYLITFSEDKIIIIYI